MTKQISGFSRLTKTEKIDWVCRHFAQNANVAKQTIQSQWIDDAYQEVIDHISENTISNFVLPYNVAPNFIINNEVYCVPMVTEESSVVAAASKTAKFWSRLGGFKTEILGTEKIGTIYGRSSEWQQIEADFARFKMQIIDDYRELVASMEDRGGGVDRVSFRHVEKDLFKIEYAFQTVDSMGANFINTVLERGAQTIKRCHPEVTIIMSILSNYTPNCLVKASVSCPIKDFPPYENMPVTELIDRFETAVHIAQIDPYRACTHNKGIFNGIDAVVIATGNDHRAIEAAGHAYAASSGRYVSLSQCKIEGEQFSFSLQMPLSLGVVGGLTKLHPLAKLSLEILNKPSATDLMQIIAAVGLAQNFAAVRSLITTGIQKGHMKMHLTNLLMQMNASEQAREAAQEYFCDKVVSSNGVKTFLANFS